MNLASNECRFVARRRRRNAMPLAVLVLGAVWGNAALAQSLVCTNGSLERLVELRYDNPGEPVPCSILYAKPTEGVAEQELWRAENEEGYCEAKFEGFVEKLSGWGWSCAAGDGPEESADAESAETGDPE